MLLIAGCSVSKQVADIKGDRYRDLALEHYLQGSLLDQKGDYAKAILEYQDALHFQKDAAIYYSIAKDYAILRKHDLAIQMGLEAVRLNPSNRIYHETLAEIYLNALDIDNSLKEYQEVTKIDPSYREGWLNAAHLQEVHSPQKALETYQFIIQRFGPDGNAYYQMAQIYSAMNKFDKAAEAMRGMLELDPGNFEIKKRLGDFFLRQDSIEEALRIYNNLAEIHPENLEVRAAIAHAYLVKQDYDHAAEQFNIVLMKDSISVDDQIRFGQIFLSFIEKDSAVVPYAITLFEKIQKSYSSDWRPYWFLGAINNVMKKDSSALFNFGKVIEIAKWNPDGWIGVASIHYDRNRFDDAIQVLIEAKKFVPEEYRIYFLLGISYQRKHQDVEAASVLEEAIQLNDKSVEALSALGLVYDEMKRYGDSDSIYEHAIRLDPKNHLLLNNYGYSLAERGLQLERALQMSKEALQQQPNNQSYLDTYGWIHYRLGDYKEAEKWIHKAIELGSNSSVIHDHLGDIYFKMSEKGKAMECWRKALEIDPNNQPIKDKIQRGSL